MKAFVTPKFRKEISGIAESYGGINFWLENLNPIANPDAIWRALLYIGCIRLSGYEDVIRSLMVHKDSRVRAWACFALGQLEDDFSIEQIRAMNADPSNRVRIHAWQAIQVLVGPEQSSRIFPIRMLHGESPILISEDSQGMGKYLSSLLSKLGFPILVSTNSKDTLSMALRYKPRAIITDNQKGYDNLSGLNMVWDLCRITDLRETVLFMLTADNIEPIFLWSGGDYYLSKINRDIEKLVKVVNEYLLH